MNIATLYTDATAAIVDAMGGSHALAHVHAGLAIYVLVQILTRDRRASVQGLLAVAGLALANEILQFGHYQSPRWADSVGDVAMTLLWPVVLHAVGRFRRRRWVALQAAGWIPEHEMGTIKHA